MGLHNGRGRVGVVRAMVDRATILVDKLKVDKATILEEKVDRATTQEDKAMVDRATILVDKQKVDRATILEEKVDHNGRNNGRDRVCAIARLPLSG